MQNLLAKCKIDELGRVLVSKVVRTPLNIKQGDDVFLTVSEDHVTAILQKPDEQNPANKKLDELARVVLPKELRNTLGWNVKDTLGVFADTEESTISFVLIKKAKNAA